MHVVGLHVVKAVLEDFELAHRDLFVRTVGDEEEEVLGIADVSVFKQRAVEHIVEHFLHAVLALSDGDTEEGFAAVFHDGLHVVEIDVLAVGDSDDFGHALDGVFEDVIHLTVRLVDGQRVVVFHQVLVVDNDEGIDILAHLLDAVFSGGFDALAFEFERFSDDTDGEDAHLLGHFGDHRGCTGAGTFTHTGGDEEHLRVLADELLDFILALGSELASHVGIRTRTQTVA